MTESERHSSVPSPSQESERLAETARQHAESHLSLSRALNERVKELTVLYELTRLLQAEQVEDAALFDAFALLLPRAFQYPETCAARVCYAKVQASTPEFRESPWTLQVPFATGDGRTGSIEVVYLKRPTDVVPPADVFLPEERQLLRSLADMLCAYMERKRAETERKFFERQLQQAQKLDAVGRLAAGIAHDFNNVLSTITMSSDLLLEEIGKDHPAIESVTEIRLAAERAAGLTRQLLAFSRQQALEPKVVDLNKLAANLEKMLRRVLDTEIRLETHCTKGLGAVRADPGQIEQVILNLAMNARDAMCDGGTLTIRTENVDCPEPFLIGDTTLPKGQYVVLSVRDTGTGIEPEALAQMFEPFFTTKEPGKGTGLGLAMVYGIVRQSNGGIDVESELGKGTCFRVFLPRVHEASDTAPAKPLQRSDGKTETILLLEADPASRLMTRKSLARLGYRILEAADAQQARQLANVYVGAIDLLLSDCAPPGATAAGLVEELTQVRPKLRVLFMSNADDNAISKASLPPHFDSIQKPCSINDLANQLRAVLDEERQTLA